MTATLTETETATVEFTPLDVPRFGRILTDALGFASSDSMRPVLYGVLVEVLDDGRVQMVATNSYVLAWIRDDEGARTIRGEYVNGEGQKPSTTEPVISGTLPPTLYERDGLTEIAKRLLKVKPGEKLTITLDEKAFTATGEGWTLAARAYDAQYPDWAQLIPKLDGEPEALPTPAIDVKWLAMLGKLTLGRAVRKGESVWLNYRTFGDRKPAAVTGETHGVEFVGLIMPVTVKS